MRSRLSQHKQLARADGGFAFLLALACVVYANSSRLPLAELHHILAVRITVLNAAFAGSFILLWAYCFDALRLYRPEHYPILDTVARITVGCALMTAVLILYFTAARTTGATARTAMFFFVCSFTYEIFRIFGSHRFAARDPQLVVIVGTGPRAARAWREIRRRYNGSVKILGFVDNRSVEEMSPEIAERYLGTIEGLSKLLLRNVVDELLVAVPLKSSFDIAQRAIEIAQRVGVHVVYMQDLYVATVKQNSMDSRGLFNELVPLPEHYIAAQVVKRLVDIAGSLVGLFALAPVFLIVALAVKVTSKGPVFFSQQRFGYRRRLFRMYKFRSMVSNAPELMAPLESRNEASGPIFKIRHDPRITRLGRFLRVSSLDELPQLWNVLIGNMSLVGPRPMSVRDVSRFSEAMLMRRFTVKPGITGLWQVSGRGTLAFEKWIEMDFSYIDSWSLALDFHILARTIRVVLKGEGAV